MQHGRNTRFAVRSILRGFMADPFANRPEDILNKSIKAGVGMLPVVGSPLVEFLAFVIGDPAQERRDDFMKETLDRVVALEGKFDGLRIDVLRSNEQFQATFIQSVRIATTTADATKKRILQNAILNSAIISMSETIRQIFMQNLDRVTPLHAGLLNFLDNPSSHPAAVAAAKGIMAGSLITVIDAALPHFTANKEIFDRVCIDLYSMGLTSNDSFGGMQSGSGLLDRRTTPLGQSFLAFISDPETGEVPGNNPPA
jgi:hypothetical protein